MNFYKYFCLVVATVLLILAEQSNANEKDIRSTTREFDTKWRREKNFKIRHQPAMDTIEQIEEQARATEDKALWTADIEAARAIKRGYTSAIKCTAIAGEKAYLAIELAKKTRTSDPIAAEEIVKQGIAETKEGIDLAEVAAYQPLGIATAYEGDKARSGLKKAIEFVTHAGAAAKSGADIGQVIVIQIFKAGGLASKQGLNAINDALLSAGANTYSNILKSAHYAFTAINKSRHHVHHDENEENEEEDETLGTEAAKNSAEATAAIEDVNNAADAALSEMIEGFPTTALRLVQEGIIKAIKRVATVTTGAHDVIEISVHEEPILASGLIYEAFKEAQLGFVAASAYVYQSLGVASKIIGSKIDGFEAAMKATEIGATAANQILDSGKLLAARGYREGEEGIKFGIIASTDAVLTAAFAAYVQYTAAANIAFDHLKSSQY